MFRYATIIALLWILPVAAIALEDPTQPPLWRSTDIPQAVDAEPAIRHWNLTSILIASNRRLAVINGRTVAQGDFIDDAQITAIEPGQVTLTFNGQQTQLRLLPTLKKIRQ